MNFQKTFFLILIFFFSFAAAKAFFFKNKKENSQNIDSTLDEYLILYSQKNVHLASLKDMKTLKTWDIQSSEAQLTKNCELLFNDNASSNTLKKIDWQGKKTWEYQAEGIIRDNFQLTKQGNLVLISTNVIPENIELELNCKNSQTLSDEILEINQSGETKFNWLFHKHYRPFLDNDWIKCNSRNLTKIESSLYNGDFFNWADPSSIYVLGENKWWDQGYTQFKPGNYLVSLRKFNRLNIIEKTSKRVVWTYEGDNAKLVLPGKVEMIPKGLPGAGNIMVFDRGEKFSRIIEFNPINKKTVWLHKNHSSFISRRGGFQRLKNGDTFLSDDASLRSIIVGKDSKIKWKYSNQSHYWSKVYHLYPKKDFAHCLR